MAEDPIRDRIRELVKKDLAKVKAEEIDPAAFGWGLYDGWKVEDQLELMREHEPLVRSIARSCAIELTNLKPPDPTGQKDFWPLERFVSTPTKGRKIKYRYSQWAHQLIEREEEITETRRSNRKFDHGEERRALLRKAGMEADKTMTVEQAIEILEKKAEKKKRPPPGKEPPEPEGPSPTPA